jgi:hypothetical protein
MHLAFDHQLELAGEDTHDLLVRMLMLGEGRAGVDIHP